jgi:hypothetical protein
VGAGFEVDGGAFVFEGSVGVEAGWGLFGLFGLLRDRGVGLLDIRYLVWIYA